MKKLAFILITVFALSHVSVIIISSSMAGQDYVLNIADDETHKEKDDLKKDINRCLYSPVYNAGIRIPVSTVCPLPHLLSAYTSLNPEVATPPPDQC